MRVRYAFSETPFALFAISIFAMIAACGGATETAAPPALAVSSVTVSPSESAISGVGIDAELTANLLPQGASAAVTWSTDNPAVATVTGSGTRATVRSVSAGSARIVARAGSLEGAATVTVTLKGVSISGATSVIAGDPVQLTAKVVVDSGVPIAVTWSSSNSAIASVSATTGLVSTLAIGTVTITARVTNTNFSATHAITTQPAVFPMKWTETREAKLDPLPGVGALAWPITLPDGRTIALVGDGVTIAIRSTSGTWAQQSLSTPAITRIGSSPNGQVFGWNASSGVVTRRDASGAWTQDATLNGNGVYDLAAIDDGRAAALMVNGAVYVRSTAGAWSAIAPVPLPAGARVRAIAMNTRGAIVVSAQAQFNGVPTGSHGWTLFRWNGTIWADMGVPSDVSYAESGGVAVLDDGTVYVSAVHSSTNSLPSAIYRGSLSNPAWTTEWDSPYGETGAFATSFTRCSDGTLAVYQRDGRVVAKVGATWQVVLGGPSAGSPLVFGIACASASRWVLTNAADGTVASADNGRVTLERAVTPLNRLSVGSSTNVLASAYGSSVAWAYDGTKWTPFVIPSESVNSSLSPAVVAWGAVGGFISSAGYVAQRNGSQWTWERRTAPSAAAATQDGVTIWLAGNDSRPPVCLSACYGSGLQTFVNNGLRDMMPGGSAVSSLDMPPDGSLYAMPYISNNTILRVVNGVVTHDAIPASIEAYAAISSTQAIFVDNNSGNTMLWSAGTVTTTTPWPRLSQERINAVVVRSANEVYAFTNQKRILGYRGTGNWQVIGSTNNVVNTGQIRGDFGAAVGPDGTVLYGRPQ